MRKVQDYYYRKAKKQNYPARSVFKLEEVQRRFRLMRPGDSVLDIGCHPGSWSLFASETVGPRGIVVGVDIQETSGSPRGGGSAIHWLCMDIREPEFISRVRRLRSGFRVVIADIAPKTTGNRWADHQQSMRLAGHTLNCAAELLLERGNYLCKVFQGEDLEDFVSRVRHQFATTRIVKPDSSRKESREVFVLGLDYRRPRQSSSRVAAGGADF